MKYNYLILSISSVIAITVLNLNASSPECSIKKILAKLEPGTNPATPPSCMSVFPFWIDGSCPGGAPTSAESECITVPVEFDSFTKTFRARFNIAGEIVGCTNFQIGNTEPTKSNYQQTSTKKCEKKP
jgi:hypothetical protein